MASIMSTIQDTVPISLFNSGLAGQIFESVKQSGAKVVMKDDLAECVLLSPEEYLRMVDELNDAKLLALAMERMERYDPSTTISQEDFDRRFGITEEDLKGYEKVELE